MKNFKIEANNENLVLYNLATYTLYGREAMWKEPAMALTALGFSPVMRSVNGGLWTDNKSKLCFEKNGVRYLYGSIENAYAIYRQRGGAEPQWFRTPLSEHGAHILLPERDCNGESYLFIRGPFPFAERRGNVRYIPVCVLKLPSTPTIMAKDGNDGMRFLGADADPIDWRFEKPFNLNLIQYGGAECTEGESYTDSKGWNF